MNLTATLSSSKLVDVLHGRMRRSDARLKPGLHPTQRAQRKTPLLSLHLGQLRLSDAYFSCLLPASMSSISTQGPCVTLGGNRASVAVSSPNFTVSICPGVRWTTRRTTSSMQDDCCMPST